MCPVWFLAAEALQALQASFRRPSGTWALERSLQVSSILPAERSCQPDPLQTPKSAHWPLGSVGSVRPCWISLYRADTGIRAVLRRSSHSVAVYKRRTRYTFINMAQLRGRLSALIRIRLTLTNSWVLREYLFMNLFCKNTQFRLPFGCLWDRTCTPSVDSLQ